MNAARRSTRSKKLSKSKSRTLNGCVQEVMEKYFADLDGHEATDIYDLVLTQVEKPLFEVVMKHSRGNISHAAELLGINRATLRNRLKKYGLDR